MATVALVGRPNTGKSTLFNKLVGGRIAITLREPGITRDRIIRTAEWAGRAFQVIDTGGLVPDSDDVMDCQIENQVSVALGEADVIVLVVDGREGLSPLDADIARRLRRGETKFLVAVNKLDARRDFDPAEFHALGGEELVPISAEHGTGVDELLDAILPRLPGPKRAGPKRAVGLAILGRPNVGKSSLLNALLGDERAIVTDIPGTTRDVIEETVELDGRAFRLLDTAGIRKRARVKDAVEYYSVSRAIDVIERCDIALLVLDATEGPTAQDKKLANLIEARAKGLVIVANKMDLVARDLLKPVESWVRKQLSFVGYAPVVHTSVLKGEGVTDTLRAAGHVWESGGRRLGSTLLREAVLPRLQSKQPRYNCRVLHLTQTGHRPPVFRLKLTRPDLADRAYLRFVTAEIRRVFSFEGYPLIVRTSR